jgi:hypothetical protein
MGGAGAGPISPHWLKPFTALPVRPPPSSGAILASRVDDVHCNPVEHRLVDRIVDWPPSPVHLYARLGSLLRDWSRGLAGGAGGLATNEPRIPLRCIRATGSGLCGLDLNEFAGR